MAICGQLHLVPHRAALGGHYRSQYAWKGGLCSCLCPREMVSEAWKQLTGGRKTSYYWLNRKRAQAEAWREGGGTQERDLTLQLVGVAMIGLRRKRRKTCARGYSHAARISCFRKVDPVLGGPVQVEACESFQGRDPDTRSNLECI